MSFQFEITKRSKRTKARTGIIHTPHGKINTPAFMPVGTQATVKSLTPEQIKNCGAEIILANTYHLALRPGTTLIKEHGGLHHFMNWKGPILTDSGGYQVFSLSKKCKIHETGVTFQSHIDGSSHQFTPKNVIDHQLNLNSDILMPLDICSPYPSDEEKIENDLKKTHQWEKEAKAHWEKNHDNRWLFAIIQGGMHKKQREKSAQYLTNLDFPGYAIGGLSVGEPQALLEEMIAFTSPLLPENKPRYVMGIGLPENIKFAIHQGIDCFDCVIPTRLARHGQVFIKEKRINITRQEFTHDLSPIDKDCQCYTCRHYSKAYLRHLFQAKEMLASTLLSIHNIQALINIVNKVKEEID